MKTSRKRARRGRLVFLIPIVLVIALIAYAVVIGSASPYGTLVVGAQTSGRYFQAFGLNASADIGGHTGTTPFSLSLSQGTYTVVYGNLPWFSTPPAKSVTVLPGKTAYAIAEYNPLVESVAIQNGKFNQTALGAEHGVTPVVWVNGMGTSVSLYSNETGSISILPMQNFTHVFTSPGTYLFSVSPKALPSLTIVVY